MLFQELNADQLRESVNSQQRFELLAESRRRLDAYRGSMTFAEVHGKEYLIRSYYDPVSGRRRQKSLGPRDDGSQKLHDDFVLQRVEASVRHENAREFVERQAGINRALGLGRVPDIGGRIMRALADAGLMGRGLRVVGTNALFAYEAATGVRFSSDVTTTDDIDVLFDARVSLRFVADEDLGERTLLGLLRRVDRSFVRSQSSFQASNRDGYLVDLVRPMRNPPWREERSAVADNAGDLEAVQIEGLAWHENAPAFSAVALDSRGYPTPMVATDPRAFAVHKLWLSQRPDRSAIKRLRDAMQAKAVARLVVQHLPQLPFDPKELRNLPRELVEQASFLFAREAGSAHGSGG